LGQFYERAEALLSKEIEDLLGLYTPFGIGAVWLVVKVGAGAPSGAVRPQEVKSKAALAGEMLIGEALRRERCRQGLWREPSVRSDGDMIFAAAEQAEEMFGLP
jgi:hypothetical protein